ncbi:MAG: phosphate regulon transcriptional regulator PhoB [Rhizobiaceae bacterium]|nr:phosphate regulon transcriptional regulator PhoB [Rhizobiaceae bacterium]
MSIDAPPLALVIEDEPAQMALVSYNLKQDGFQLAEAFNGEEGLLLAEELLPDIIVLDWMLPEVSGIEICRQLKKHSHTKDIPIIMLTARGEEADRIRGQDTGADGYMTKPYSINELIARTRSILRRTRPSSVGEIMSYAGLVLDSEQHRVMRNSKPVKLGPTEFRLLSALIEKPTRVWSRDLLLDRVWGREFEVDSRTVDVHIGRLRKGLHQKDQPGPIRTVRGFGYSLDIENQC